MSRAGARQDKHRYKDKCVSLKNSADQDTKRIPQGIYIFALSSYYICCCGNLQHQSNLVSSLSENIPVFVPRYRCNMVHLYRKLKSINIAVLSPKQLFSKTATIKLLTLSGEIFIGMCLVFFFALLLPSVWTFHRIGFWIMTIGLILGIVYSIFHYWPFHYWPQYVKLFRDLNSIKE